MTGETRSSRNPAGRAGFFTNLLALANALASFFESRAALFASESKEALTQLLALVACLMAALIFFAFGYIFLIASAIAIVASALDIEWVWIALGAAGAHLMLAFVFVLVARGRMRKRPFPETAAELQKDREWLRNLDQTSRPTS